MDNSPKREDAYIWIITDYGPVLLCCDTELRVTSREIACPVCARIWRVTRRRRLIVQEVAGDGIRTVGEYTEGA